MLLNLITRFTVYPYKNTDLLKKELYAMALVTIGLSEWN